jgi:hypothetical protein
MFFFNKGETSKGLHAILINSGVGTGYIRIPAKGKFTGQSLTFTEKTLKEIEKKQSGLLHLPE